MQGNTFGRIFSITTFGESHGKAIGVVIDGCPSGLKIDIDFIQSELDRRRPGQSSITSARKEEDFITILSGTDQNITTGAPIAIIIYNQDQKPADYDFNKDKFRPSHADYTYYKKYGLRDFKGGGRQSARETAARVAAGAIAKLILKKYGVSINAFVSTVGKISMESNIENVHLDAIDATIVRCPDIEIANKMIDYILDIKNKGDSVGGIITCIIKGTPVGLGEPVFDKLHADLAKAIMSIQAVKGFEYGSGFNSVTMLGSEHNDIFSTGFRTQTNNSGGIQGGISNGENIYFKAAFKPVSTIMKEQETIDINGNKTTIQAKGRHDPCVVPRAVPIVEAMSAIVIVDHILRNKNAQL
ncbi:MAG: chorismate synthase [Solitalea-like symbiont of Tyrophagus putrescentiae]